MEIIYNTPIRVMIGGCEYRKARVMKKGLDSNNNLCYYLEYPYYTLINGWYTADCIISDRIDIPKHPEQIKEVEW